MQSLENVGSHLRDNYLIVSTALRKMLNGVKCVRSHVCRPSQYGQITESFAFFINVIKRPGYVIYVKILQTGRNSNNSAVLWVKDFVSYVTIPWAHSEGLQQLVYSVDSMQHPSGTLDQCQSSVSI